MRTTAPFLAFAAALGAAITLGPAAAAGPPPPPPTFAVSSGTITVTAGSGTHLNAQFPWSFKDGAGTKVKTVVFTFPPDPAATGTASQVPASGTLRGAYCNDTGCFPFNAACTATACTITPN